MSPENMDLSGTDLDGFLGVGGEDLEGEISSLTEAMNQDTANGSPELTLEQAANVAGSSSAYSRPIWERPVGDDEDDGALGSSALPGVDFSPEEEERKQVVSQAGALAAARQQSRSYFRPTSWRPVTPSASDAQAQVVDEGDHAQDPSQEPGEIVVDSDGEITYQMDGDPVEPQELYIDEAGNLYTLEDTANTTQAVAEGAARGIWASIPTWAKVILGIVLIKKALS